VLGEPKTAKEGPAGNRWIYFVAPWGLQMELVSFPNGRFGGDKLWDTRDPAR
jgi:glyoxylase I family protein